MKRLLREINPIPKEGNTVTPVVYACGVIGSLGVLFDGICSDGSCFVCLSLCTFSCKFPNSTTFKTSRLAKENDPPNPVEVNNTQEFLSRVTSPKEDFIADAEAT